MNKAKFNKVLSLYKDGVDPIICISIMLQMLSKEDDHNTATWIDKFYMSIPEHKIARELTSLHYSEAKMKDILGGLV